MYCSHWTGWRNGAYGSHTTPPGTYGGKCVDTGGVLGHDVGVTKVRSYAWVFSWPTKEQKRTSRGSKTDDAG
eukprot:COSAG02_NODE_347_length_24085_cov_23.240724_5_plen_72_part_00